MGDEPQPNSMLLKDFLEKTAPGKREVVSDLAQAQYPHPGIVTRGGSSAKWLLQSGPLELYCETDSCQGIRYFQAQSRPELSKGKHDLFLTYRCRNCGRSSKVYAVSIQASGEAEGEVLKVGEHPPFGPPTPARVISLIGGERENYLKGRRCESQGLGIAAFAYYRRAVENEKGRIIDEIIRVAEKLGASTEQVEDLRAARKETQFSRAVDTIKHGLPQALLVNGHNPLTLLHSALSEGLHAQPDDKCLELATSIRVVLTGLVERIAIALQDERELNDAVNRLLKAPATKLVRQVPED